MNNFTKKLTSALLALGLVFSFTSAGLSSVYAADSLPLQETTAAVETQQTQDSSVIAEESQQEEPAAESQTEASEAESPAPQSSEADSSIPDSSDAQVPVSQTEQPAQSESQPETASQPEAVSSQETAEDISVFTEEQLLAAARENGKLAAEMLNTVEQQESFETQLKLVLDLYYGEKLDAQLADFCLVIGQRAQEIVKNYADAADQRETSVLELGFEPGEVLVVYDNPRQARSTGMEEGYSVTQSLTTEDNEVVKLAEIPLDKTVEEAVEDLQEQNGAAIVQPNFVYTLPEAQVAENASAIQTSDPGLSRQWYFSNIDLEGAWNLIDTLPAAGRAPVKVAVIDSGVAAQHPDLAANVDVSRSANFAYGIKMPHAEPPAGDDDWAHGTHVAGIIAAQSNNGIGVAGVASTSKNNGIASIISINVFRTGTNSLGQVVFGANTLSVIYAINYAVSQEARIINMSLGHSPTYDSGEVDVLLERAVNNAVGSGVVVIAAAGNSGHVGNPVEYPSDFSNVLSVVATGKDNKRAYFSSYGPSKNVSAPGSDIMSTYPGGLYASFSGTSMAAPVVSGVAALALYANPDMGPRQLYGLMQNTAGNGGAFNAETAYGIINAKSVVANAIATAPGQMRSLSLEGPAKTVYLGKTAKIGATVSPAGSADSSIHWVSQNPDIAAVDGAGNVTGKALGSTVISASISNGRTALCTVTVKNPVTSVKVAQKTITLVKGQKATTAAIPQTLDGSKPKISWKSSNSKVASVDSKGKITARKTGRATITASTGGKKTTISVKIVDKAVSLSKVAITGAPKTLKVGSTRFIGAKMTPSTATGALVKYKSSSSKVLTVDSTGKITAKKPGTATITLTAGGKKATVKIKVVK